MDTRKNEQRQDIDSILEGWPYDPDAVSVRMVEGSDGRSLIQMRIEMGLLQLETTDRPDGERPNGVPTYCDLLAQRSRENGDGYLFSEDECVEADREFVQFYHRRICWLAMREFRKAVRDADHTLKLMDLCRTHSPDEEWTISHEQYRPFVLFHRIQADALAALDQSGPAEAVNAVTHGLDQMRKIFLEFDPNADLDDNELIERLAEFRETLREKFEVGKTLNEQLDEAVKAEEYERAAHLRDLIRQEKGRHI